MTDFSRRSFVAGTTTLGAVGALAGTGLTDWAKAWAQTASWKPEAGASLQLLRWKRFYPVGGRWFHGAR